LALIEAKGSFMSVGLIRIKGYRAGSVITRRSQRLLGEDERAENPLGFTG
jgi:hypothetical protein